MKKITAIITAAVMLMSCLCGCGANTALNENENSLNIVTTIFPEYDWVMNILGDKANKAQVTMLLDNGVDLHSYQPTAQDIMKISTCDLFIYVGGESDEWVEDALKEATNKDMKVINLLDVLGEKVKEEEIVEGMEAEEEQEESEESEEEEPEYDEHVWLSLKNAQICCDVICEKICEADADNAEAYISNTKEYNKKLSDLDGQYKSTVDGAKYNTLLFGDRFPFRYMTDDYGLDYYAAFVGCSAETEASFETIVFLSKKTDELTLPAIMTIEGAEHKIAETIRDNTNNKDQKILTLDSMQSVTSDDVKKSVTYISIMESNLSVLKEALN
ncbi:MAG: metal ABC transporter substrate-binding protein [Lachnospiraceae bacterium]|nr:metal ABC transporter substrate-binding protein [Lachnospiraceae bacterium]